MLIAIHIEGRLQNLGRQELPRETKHTDERPTQDTDQYLKNALGYVHAARGLKAIIEAEPGLLCHQVPQLRLLDALLAHAANELVLGLHIVAHVGC